jgi:uncharacterized protein YhbP (UPF0306 family)
MKDFQIKYINIVKALNFTNQTTSSIYKTTSEIRARALYFRHFSTKRIKKYEKK